MSYVGAIQELVAKIGPWFLHDKNIASFLESYALVLDDSAQSLEMGLRLSQPLNCDASALPVLSNDRGIRFYPTETEASKRYRISRWLPLHRQRGTHAGELKHAQPYFLPDVPVMRIVHQDGAGASATWHTLDASGAYSIHRQTPSNWNYDGSTAQWSRWWAIVYVPSRLLTLSRYGEGHRYGDGTRYAGATSTQVALDMINMLREWKGAHSKLWSYIVATDPASFNPTATPVVDPESIGASWSNLPMGNWGKPNSGPPVSSPTRLPSAVWLYDCGQG